MKVYKKFEDLPNFKRKQVNISIGCFDGIHVGHQAIIKNLERDDGLKGIITFEPHPSKVLRPDIKFTLLTTLDEKIKLLSRTDLDFVFIMKFTKELSIMPPTEFIEKILIGKFNVSRIVIGENFRFGHKSEGNVKFLEKCSEKYNFKVRIVKSTKVNDLTVSSTLIRNLLQMGELEKANRLLGYKYQINGKVVKGKGIGGKILGYPTANISYREDKLIPKEGVYTAFLVRHDEMLPGVLSIGKKPTFGEKKISVEIHIFNFNKMIYNNKINLQIVSRLRNQIKFDNDEELRNQIERDIEEAKRILRNKLMARLM